MAISGALNDFSQKMVRHVVEQEHLGKLIYAGGDDVLAMLPVADLLPAAERLSQVYSGVVANGTPEGLPLSEQQQDLKLKSGFAQLEGVFYRTMGSTATVSAGLVIAHHRAPLWKVMDELRAAESVAKNSGRNCLHLKIIKRSGNLLKLTLPWGELMKPSEKNQKEDEDGCGLNPLGLLLQLCAYLRDEAVSRRAVFHSLAWLKDLPEPKEDAEMLQSLLLYQLKRQAGDKESVINKHKLGDLAQGLAKLVVCHNEILVKKKETPVLGLAYLGNFMAVAEFLAREGRGRDDENQGAET